MDKRDLPSASIRSGTNFNVHPQFSRIEERAPLLKDFCKAFAKKLLTQGLLNKYKSKAYDT